MTDSPTGALSERDQLRSALNAMLTQFSMDEDEWNCATFNQARAALASRSTEPGGEPFAYAIVDQETGKPFLMDKTKGLAFTREALQPAMDYLHSGWQPLGPKVVPLFLASTPPPISAASAGEQLYRRIAVYGGQGHITEKYEPVTSPAPAQAPAVPAELQAQVPWLIAPEDLEPEPSSAVKASDLADQLRTFRAKRFLDWNMQENQLVVDAFHALKSEPSAPADQLRKWASEAVKLLGPEDHEVRDNLRAALAAASQPPATKGTT